MESIDCDMLDLVINTKLDELEGEEKKMTMVWQYYTGNNEAKKVVLQQIELISGKKIEEKDLVD